MTRPGSWRLAACAAGAAGLLAQMGCAARPAPAPVAAPPPLAAGFGEHVVEGIGSVPCSALDDASREQAVGAGLRDVLMRAKGMFGDPGANVSVSDVVGARRIDRYWFGQGQCFASVQAVVRTAELTKRAREESRRQTAGRPAVTFAVVSYRILPRSGVTTRRGAAEVIDLLQQELIDRGFDVRRSLKARRRGLEQGGAEVADISSAERDDIAAVALRDGVRFLVQGEIKVSDEGQQADGTYLAVVDGTVEAVELTTERVVGSFGDVSTAKHISASGAYTTAISGFARSAAGKIGPQMLDTRAQSSTRAP
ncbi:MAG: hypothetical protein HY699_19750 [Deltaproteobacteria bacterium]|nr:hypothetical protein [Deltaproteobacteria bacterium]